MINNYSIQTYEKIMMAGYVSAIDFIKKFDGISNQLVMRSDTKFIIHVFFYSIDMVESCR